MDTKSQNLLTVGGNLPLLRRPPVVALAFGIAYTAALIVALLQGPKLFYFDSGQYWALGESFTRFGHFSLLNFESQTRGYALPLIYHGLQALAKDLAWSESSLIKLFNALIFGLSGAILAPRLAEITWPRQRWGIAPRSALAALLIVFWSGYLNFPLSDFPALAMTLLALIALARPDAPGWMLLAGLATGLAIDMRAADALLAPIVIGLAAWAWWEQRGTQRAPGARRVLCLGLLAAGFLAASLPQSLAAHRHYGTWSFLPGSDSNVASQYLTPGLAYQRASGYVGPGEPGPLMYYGDPAGQRLLGEQKGHQIESIGQYLGLIASHPLAMGALFARHIVNGLDQRYSTPYIEHLHSSSQPWLRLAGFLFVFLALLRVLWPAARRRLGPARWRYPVALLLCCLTSITNAIETRYLLPVYLLSYILVLTPGWPNPIGPATAGVRRFQAPAVIIAACLAFMAVVWHITSTASSHLHFFP